MKNNIISSIYSDLNDLLYDICNFLTEEVENGKLSGRSSEFAKILIQRSKTQLTEIAKVSSPADNDSNRYVDMQQKASVEYLVPNHLENQELYSDIDANSNGKEETCPFLNMPASEVPPQEKSGIICRKEKILFIEHFKKMYVALNQQWMLIYTCAKDTKPIEAHNLRSYTSKQLEKKECCFEMIPKNVEMKSQTFTATTKKDMLQWVSEINRRGTREQESPVKTQAPIVLPVMPVTNGEIYEELHGNVVEEECKPVSKPIPILPPRAYEDRIPPKLSLPKTPHVDEEEIYDCIGGPPLEEPEEEYYAELGQPPDAGGDIYINAPDGEEIYDMIGPTMHEDIIEYEMVSNDFLDKEVLEKPRIPEVPILKPKSHDKRKFWK